MRRLRETNGKPLTDADYLTCKVGLHTLNEPVLATRRVCCYNNPLLYPGEVVYTCPECADSRLKSYREMFNFVEVEEVGKVKKPR